MSSGTGNFYPGKLWSLWDMLRLKVGRLLELHERLTVEKGNFENAQRELTRAGTGRVNWTADDLRKLFNDVSDVARIAAYAGLASTQVAAERTRDLLSRYPVDDPMFAGADFQVDAAGAMFRHLQDIVSRIRDDCGGRFYFQISSENAGLLQQEAEHFGPEVAAAFREAGEDIAEAATCLAFERTTASVFHLMRAMEIALQALATKVEATVQDSNGRFLTWGIILSNVGRKIDAMPYGPEKDRWSNAHALLHRVNVAWRTGTMHPKQTYTESQARNVFESTKSFMASLAPLI